MTAQGATPNLQTQLTSTGSAGGSVFFGQKLSFPEEPHFQITVATFFLWRLAWYEVLPALQPKRRNRLFLNSVDPTQNGAMLWSIKLSECAHMANDAPKIVKGLQVLDSQVLDLIDEFLGQAGLKRASSRSSNVLRPRRRLQHLDRSLILEALKFPPSSVS